jgi:hypothetical protein
MSIRTIQKTDFQTEDVLVWRSVLGLMERNLSFVLGLHHILTHTQHTKAVLHGDGEGTPVKVGYPPPYLPHILPYEAIRPTH